MKRFTIDRSIIGTEKHLIVDEDGYVWSSSVPKDSLYLNGKEKSTRCFDTVLSLINAEIPCPPEKYIESIKSTVNNYNEEHIPWQYVLPPKIFKEYFKNLVSVLKTSFKVSPIDYYVSFWGAGSRVLDSLKPSLIDEELFNILIEESSSPGLESFRPKRAGYALIPEYDRLSTRTGRLTITKGPNILVLKKDNRKIIKSSFEDGKIVSLDFRALEARIVLAESGKYSTSEDIYEEISRSQFGGVLPRDIVKTAVIAELYGISRGALRTRLGVSEKKLDSFISIISEYFEINLIKNRLREEIKSTGKILNRFGRPLTVPEGQDNLLVNTFAQSSGVDVSLLGFDQILNLLGTDGIRPLFVLHDAIILDVRSDKIKDVESIKSIQIPTYEKEFLLKFEILS